MSSKKPEMNSAGTGQSQYYYIPIAFIVFVGYLVGGWLSFGVQYLALLPEFLRELSPQGRRVLVLFGLGLLGGATSAHLFFANDANKKLYLGEKLPNFMDPAGYALHIIS